MAIPKPLYNPQFPYTGEQIILSADRVTLHSKNDAIFLFGKQAVGLSSVRTINLDANEQILLYCNKITLGENANQPLVLGRFFNTRLKLFIEEVNSAAVLLAQCSESEIGTSMQAIASAGKKLNKACKSMLNVIEKESFLSKNTYTK
jgi:hypothetical protein